MATLDTIMNNTQIVPRSEEAEKLILGTLITESKWLNEIRELLPVDSFYFDMHKKVYRAILSLSDKGEKIDVMTVMAELPKIGEVVQPSEIASLAMNYAATGVIEYVHIINEKFKRRKFFELGAFLQSNAFSEVNDVNDVLADVKERMDSLFNTSSDNVYTLHDALDGVNRIISRNMSGETELTGDPTGFKNIDKRSGGLQGSDLVIIAAETSQGKTSMAIKMAMNCNAPVAFYSMEMKKEQIAARMMSIASGIPSNEILFSRLDEMKIQQIDRGVGKIYNKPVYFDDRSTSNIETILASIRMMKAKYGIHGAVIDYLQILNVNMRGESKERQMGEVARRLKNIAKELDIWIIALSQLNRDASNPVPTIARLRDSGQIAEAADMVILIYRPEVYGDNKRFPDGFSGYETKGNALIDVAKGRNTGLTKFLVGFHAKTTDFFDLGNAPKLFTDESRSDDLPF